MRDLYRKLAVILDKRERQLAVFVLLLTIIAAVIEVLGVASIMPFMAVLANPEIITTNAFLSYLYDILNFQSTDTFLFFLGVCVLIFLVGSSFLRALVVWAQIYYANLRNYSISSRLVSSYLQKPYQWFLVNNSSKLASFIIEEVARVVYGSIYPALRLITHLLIALLLMILFLLVDPVLAISTALFLGVTYGAIFKFASKHLANEGSLVSVVQYKRLQAIQEAFAGIKDVKITGLENSFLEKYRKPTLKLAFHRVAIKLWSEMPSFAMQALVFGGMMVVILYLMKTRGSLEETIPVLAMYALGGYKLMPSLQEIYKQLASIKGNQSALDNIYKSISLIDDLESTCLENNHETSLGIRKSLELRELQFTYPETNKIVLHDVNLKIEKNSTVGFVGSSGSGKTTTVDIILGLLEPDHGSVVVDEQVIDKHNLRAWQHSLGYVPQQIFLTDDSIAANIAFGIPHNQIDYMAVEKAARTANLHKFIISELSEGYDAIVGERGIRLSGGQRQRIGIARALYHDPDLLILDEATSALDNITEKAVMDAVGELGHKKTIIIVAHRLSTIQSCDKIFLFDNGKIISSGKYEELVNTSPTFREMALMQK